MKSPWTAYRDKKYDGIFSILSTKFNGAAYVRMVLHLCQASRAHHHRPAQTNASETKEVPGAGGAMARSRTDKRASRSMGESLDRAKMAVQ